MKIDIITLFPNMFAGPFDESMVKRAQEKKIVTIGIHNLRNWAIDERGTVDAHPYGGGPGMLIRPEPVFNAVNDVRSSKHDVRKANSKIEQRASKIVLLDAGGELFNQERAIEYSTLDHLICLCGHYEGFDYRVHEKLADDVISIGNFVVTGGEIPCMLVVDSVVRLLPGVLNKEEGHEIESFSKNLGTLNTTQLVEFPQYTRPEEFEGMKVPEVLLSGHHAQIEKWRHEKAFERTKKNRPDLFLDK
jgi:tRNA (guanine37-N1)-methyltransferase